MWKGTVSGQNRRRGLGRGLLLLFLWVVLVGSGCWEESKTDCRNDGDCRGVRVCRGGVCETPEGLENSGLPPRDTGPSDSARDVSDTSGEPETAPDLVTE